MGFDTFHNDLMAAVRARAPIELSSHANPKRLTRSALDRARSSVGDSLSDSSPEQMKALESRTDLPPRYKAALQTFGRTKLMVPVLEGLSARLIAQRQVNQVLRHALAYLLFLLGAALVGLLVYLYRVVPTMDMIREDISKNMVGQTGVDQGFNWVDWIPTLTIVLAVLLILFSLWALFGGMTRIAMRLGGNYFVRCRTSAAALQTAQLLMEHGADVEEAVSVSCELTAADSHGREEIQSAIEEMVSFQLAEKVEAIGGREFYLDPALRHVHSISNYLMVSAQKRLEYMKLALPMGMVTIFGGVVAVVYCLSVFVPIVELIRDLGGVGL